MRSGIGPADLGKLGRAAVALWLLGAAMTAHAAARVVTYPAPAGEPASADYSVEVDGKPVFVYSANVLHGGPASFAYFDFSGRVSVKVTASRGVRSATVRPASFGIDVSLEGRTISFDLSRPRNLTLELDGSLERPLHLFANPLEANVPRPGDPKVMYFGPGVHEIGTTKVPSGTTVYVAGGAIVRGKIMPGEKPVQERNWAGNKVYRNLICVENAKNVTIRGRGVLDMSGLPWHSKCPIVISLCEDVTVEGIIIKDSPCWCMPSFGCKRGKYLNVKQVCHRENSDGINIVNSQDMLVEGCFLRNNDDEICVKTTSGPPAQESKGILVRDCVVWNDRAYAIGVTYETRQDIRDLTFRDCDVIHDTGIASLVIHASDGGTISGVRFENIRVEDCRSRFVRLWIGKDFWGHDPERGHVRDVTFKDVALTGGGFAGSELTGCGPANLVERVRFENLTIHGKAVTSAEEGRFSVNQFAKDVWFVTDTTPPEEAPKRLRAEARSDSEVELSWDAVDDPESGVRRYNVYRGGAKVGEAPATTFRDRGLREKTGYTYEVAAVNGSGLEGPRSKPATARTPVDRTPPAVADVCAVRPGLLRVTFTEPVEARGAGDAASYSLDGGVAVKSAVPEPDGRTVALEVSDMTDGREYALSVRGVRDRAEKPNAVAPGTRRSFTYSSGLILRWTFDEAGGAEVADRSPSSNTGRLAGGARRAGGAVVLDHRDGDDYVEARGSATLAKVQEGDFTLVARFKALSVPPGEGAANDASYAILMKAGYHLGLRYSNDRRFALDYWLAGNVAAGVASGRQFDAGELHTIAGVVERSTGTLRLFVDGRLEAESTFNRGLAARDYGATPWRAGVANPGAGSHRWAAHGELAEARIYSRALSEGEVRALSQGRD